MSSKPLPKPAAWKNTYFWLAGILLIIGIIGTFAGQEAIRDPGQRRENYLTLIYFGGAIVMFVNGWISHRQTVQHYLESQEDGEE